PAFFEYVQITAIDAVNGIVTFSKPLRNEYKSTWPAYWSDVQNADFLVHLDHVDQGGWATLYDLHPEWDTEIDYQGLTIAQPNQSDLRDWPQHHVPRLQSDRTLWPRPHAKPDLAGNQHRHVR